MGKAVRVDEASRLAKALAKGAEYLIVGHRRFRILEVEGEYYDPIDPEEIRAVEEALHDDTDVLDPEEGRNYLKEQLRQYGIG